MTVPIPNNQSSLPTPDSTASYWHRSPSKKLLGHRTTPSLPTKADLVIVGSGIAGASAAHFLYQNDAGKDLDVVMLEAREACWGATGRNGGHCQPMVFGSPPDIAAFELRNYAVLKKMIEENGIECEWKSVRGCHAYSDVNMFEKDIKHLEVLQQDAPDLAKQVTVVTKESTNPSLEDLRVSTAVGAFVQENAASLWPYKLVCWMLENLLFNSEAKLNLQTKTPVTRLQKVQDGSWIVHTDRGMIAAKKVLLTTNAYTSHLLPQFSDLIVPVQGEMSALLPPSAMSPKSSMHKPLQHSYGFMGYDNAMMIYTSDYLVQRPFSSSSSDVERGGELMFGGGRQLGAQAGIGISDDSFISEPVASYLRRELVSALDLQTGPEVSELEATYEWSGIMGYSRDGRPWVGEVSEELGGGEGLFLCAGFTGHGMPNACLSAKGAVDLMLGKEEVDVPNSDRISAARLLGVRGGDEVGVKDMKGFYV
ncbi:hypothetical protein HYFRA_00004286 [Hymenoscyphus fraxineus]|uniref:FAD dependent oxidoreductase domain-containing protein n=1 Tax=Hymenoscyphus fraxineus TaxID=746836 RepID=A0A9N9PF57_9HELO|nr:hypothetical protein HYFRA_00004286 [Hymenoscyphus fraxineus]